MLKSHGRTPRLTFGRLLLLALAAAVPMGLTLAMEPPTPAKAPDAQGQESLSMATPWSATAASNHVAALKKAWSADRRVGPRQYEVFQLRHSTATELADAINEFLRSESQATGAQPLHTREASIVVPDVKSNSLLIAASESMTDTIAELIEKLDQGPPTVLIEMLLVEVSVANEDEASASIKLARLRALSGTERTMEDLFETLKKLGRVEVLSRPMLTLPANRPASLLIGQVVPPVTGVKKDDGEADRAEMEIVGLSLRVTPRITPEGRVVMEVDAEQSELGPIKDGAPIDVFETGPKGEVIRLPRTKLSRTRTLSRIETAISAADGEVAVFAGPVVVRDVSIKVDGGPVEVDSRLTQLVVVLRPHIVKDDGE